jgi:hypothetical protein
MRTESPGVSEEGPESPAACPEQTCALARQSAVSCVHYRSNTSKWGKVLVVDHLLRRVRSGLNDGDFTLLYLWIRFRANGGCARRADPDAVLRGLQALSDHDTLVLDLVIAELHNP